MNPADTAPRAYNLDSPLDKATVLRLSHSRHWISGPVSVRVSRNVRQLLARIVGFHCRNRQVKIQASGSLENFSARVKCASVGDASLYDRLLSRTEDPVSLHSRQPQL